MYHNEKGGELVNERIKELRKELGLSMEKFGEQLGVHKTTIQKIENGTNNLTDQMFKSICREFNVSEEWLREGKGDMFLENSNSIIGKIISEIPLDDFSQTILKAYIEMDSKKREAFNVAIKEIASAISTEHLEEKNEGENAPYDLSEKEKFLQMAAAEFDKEKEQELSAYSVKELGVG